MVREFWFILFQYLSFVSFLSTYLIFTAQNKWKTLETFVELFISNKRIIRIVKTQLKPVGFFMGVLVAAAYFCKIVQNCAKLFNYKFKKLYNFISHDLYLLNNFVAFF